METHNSKPRMKDLQILGALMPIPIDRYKKLSLAVK